jgi:hypothetical protein
LRFIIETNSPSSFHHKLQNNKTHQKQRHIRSKFFDAVKSLHCHQFSHQAELVFVASIHKKTSNTIFRLQHNIRFLGYTTTSDFLGSFFLFVVYLNDLFLGSAQNDLLYSTHSLLLLLGFLFAPLYRERGCVFCGWISFLNASREAYVLCLFA